MLSPSTAVHPEPVEGERRLRTGLSKHEIDLGNSPLRPDPDYPFLTYFPPEFLGKIFVEKFNKVSILVTEGPKYAFKEDKY